VLEIEAGRGAANSADYRDLVRASLLVDAEYLVLAMMLRYRMSIGAGRGGPAPALPGGRAPAEGVLQFRLARHLSERRWPE